MTWHLTPELEATVLHRLEDGESLVQICNSDGMPSRSTVLRWQRDNADFAAKCAHAREAQGDLAAEEQDDIAMRTLRGEVPPDVARVVISAKQWRASKLAPKKYGEKLHQEVTGKDGSPLSASSVAVSVTPDLVKSIIQQVRDEF